MPTTFADDNEIKEQIEDINKQGFGDKYTADLVNYVNNIKSGAARNAEAQQGAVAGFVGKSTGENLEKSKALKEALATRTPNKEQRAILAEAGYHYDKATRKWVK
jgi:hypothetical protein